MSEPDLRAMLRAAARQEQFLEVIGRDDATAMCNQLKKAKMSCLAMQS